MNPAPAARDLVGDRSPPAVRRYRINSVPVLALTCLLACLGPTLPVSAQEADAGIEARPAQQAQQTQQSGAAVEVAAGCKRLLLVAGEYLSHVLERWVKACLGKPGVWMVGDIDTYRDYELTGTRTVALPRGFESLREHLAQSWSVRALEDGDRVVFDDDG